VATVIKFKASSSMSSPQADVRVNESVADVTASVNAALTNKLPLVALTDAETGKGLTIRPSRVSEVIEE
jgi:hypothetical protein